MNILFLISIFKNTKSNQLLPCISKAVHLPLASSLLPLLCVQKFHLTTFHSLPWNKQQSSRSVSGSSHTLLLRYLVYPLLPSRLCSCEPILSTPSFYWSSCARRRWSASDGSGGASALCAVLKTCLAEGWWDEALMWVFVSSLIMMQVLATRRSLLCARMGWFCGGDFMAFLVRSLV